MIRILYSAFDVVPSPKGASTHITYFVRGLVERGYVVRLFTPGDGILPETDVYEGAPILRVPTGADPSFLSRALVFGNAALDHVRSSEPYQVMHYRSLWSGFALAQNKKRFGYKTLFEVNGLPSVELKYHYPGLHAESGMTEVTSLMQKIREQELATLALSDAVVCPSEVTRAYLISLGVPQRLITVIPNGVPGDFLPTPLLPQDGHVPTILYHGTLADWQGIEVLIDSMSIVLENRPVRLRIIGRGRGRQRKALMKQIRKRGLEQHVSLESAVPHHDIPAVLASADVCVAPLALNDRNVTQGCCPIKVLEAMAAGRPLVASNLPVVRELAREDVDALLFAPEDPSDLARQILRAISDRDLAARLAANASSRAHSDFSWHNAQKKLAKVYEKLLIQ